LPIEGVRETELGCSIRRHLAGFKGVTTRMPQPQQQQQRWLAVLRGVIGVIGVRFQFPTVDLFDQKNHMQPLLTALRAGCLYLGLSCCASRGWLRGVGSSQVTVQLPTKFPRPWLIPIPERPRMTRIRISNGVDALPVVASRIGDGQRRQIDLRGTCNGASCPLMPGRIPSREADILSCLDGAPNGTQLDSGGIQRLGMERHPRTVTWSTIEAEAWCSRFAWKSHRYLRPMRRNLRVLKGDAHGVRSA
jgi:hypothetical protein